MAQVAKTVTRKVASRLGPRHRALRIEGVPFWATKGDLKRMCERVRAGPVIDVTIESTRGLPTGFASLEFGSSAAAKSASLKLPSAQISGIPIRVAGFQHGMHPQFIQQRRIQEQDIARMAVAGGEKGTVVIFGFPKEWKVRDVEAFLADYRLELWGEPIDAFERLCGSKDRSRWAIHLSSLNDAYRLVRHLHMRRFALGGRTDTLLGARVLY